MNIDLPLAGWLLSALTFILGTITPILYQRFLHEGVGIRQPFKVRAVLQNEQQKQAAAVAFSTIIKIANSQKDSILLDNIKLTSQNAKGVRFEINESVILCAVDPKNLFFPFTDDPKYEQIYFPLIIKSNEERMIGLEISFKYSPKDTDDPWNILGDHIGLNGLPIKFLINGKYRDYVLRIQDDK